MPARGQIVCATDFTARSDLALSRAAWLAQQTGARLTLVHAVDRRQSDRVLRAQVNRAYVRLLSKVDQTFGAASAAVDIAVRAGGPLDVIAKVADKSNADLVVLAAPQPRRFDSIFGTSAERLLRATRRPILVVHRETQGNYRRVAMAVDLANASLPLIQTAARLGALNDAETTLLHAAHGWHGAALLRLQAMLTAAEMDVERTRIEVRTGPAAVVIQNALEAERPELLAIGASRWLLIRRLLARSVANSVLSKPICDVLVIPQRVYLRPATDATGAGATEPSTIPPHRAA